MEKDPFKEYLRESEPDKAYKGYAWSTAIGLQEVDGLKPSKYLIDTAIQNIEGKITMKEANMIFHRRKILVIKAFRWMRLFIILQYLFLHISGLLNKEKVDIQDVKVDIEKGKVDIESVLSVEGSDFTVKTMAHIHRLFEEFGFDGVFGRSAVMEILELKSSGASKLLSNLVQADIIEPVSGHGKGKYKFKK